jgi:hypothetical protein
MPTVTLTCTANMAAPPRAVHAGVNALVFYKNQADNVGVIFGTAGDVMLLGKLPNGATLLSADGRVGVMSTTLNYVLRVVYPFAGGTTFTTISPVLTATSVVRLSLTAPYKVSISDSEPLNYATLQLYVTTGASATTSFSIGGMVLYTADGQENGL